MMVSPQSTTKLIWNDYKTHWAPLYFPRLTIFRIYAKVSTAILWDGTCRMLKIYDLKIVQLSYFELRPHEITLNIEH